MAVLLAWGVVAERDLRAWLVDSGELVDSREHEPPEGAAVVLGDKDSDPDEVASAREALAELIAAGGVVVAGAGIDLGDGFVSARLAGATGDRRDAVLAGLRVLGVEGGARLGERAATLVALFGVTATKPVGAAAERAIAEQRWAALGLASAAADVLGPEQLVQVLGWQTSEGIDPLPDGAPSDLAVNLARVLGNYPRPRRLELLRDLWEQVIARKAAALAAERLIATQDLRVLDALRKRCRHYDADLAAKTALLNPDVPYAFSAAIHYVPTWDGFWRPTVERLIQDAIAATVLLRAAVAVHEHGVIDGIALVRDQIAAAAALVTKAEARAARRSVPDFIDLPARPISHIRDIDVWLWTQPLNKAFEKFVHDRLSTALAYARIVDATCHSLIHANQPQEMLPDTDWDVPSLRSWRNAVGYTDVRPPAQWYQHPYSARSYPPSLGDRLAADPATLEQASDLLWYADLADAMSRIHGHERAWIPHGLRVPHFDTNPPVAHPDPLTPRLDSIPLAVAGAAQLLALGATAPARCRDWAALCAGLMSSGVVVQALSSEFEVPEPILDYDGALLPGTAARIQIARTAGRLAEWSDYMGNCIAGPDYQEQAIRGRSILIALRDDQDVLQVNAELRPNDRGWSVEQIRGRFNADPDPVLKKAFQLWALTLHATDTEPHLEAEPADPRPRPRRASPNLVRELRPLLKAAVRQTLRDAVPAVRAFAAVAGADAIAPAVDAKAMTVLRRSKPDTLTRLCAAALEAGRVTLPQLWSATGTHPIATALHALEPAVMIRYPRLRRLTEDTPLPSKALRELVKDPEIGAARSIDLLALRLREALLRLALVDDPVFAGALRANPAVEFLCPLILVITSTAGYPHPTTMIAAADAVTIPGFPVSSLIDPEGPWRRSHSSAGEFGSVPTPRWEQAPDTGLRIPTSWLPRGGWPVLWSRAASHSAALATASRH